MTQNIIKLIALYLLSIFIISCGSSGGDGFTKGNPPKTDNNNDDNKTVIPSNNVVFTSLNKVSVKENTINAITLTATGNNPIVYSISTKDSSSFNINSSTGVVVFKVTPDYETKTTYSFKATAKDSNNNEDVINIIISIIDVDEKPPVFISSNKIRMKENSLPVVTVKTKDDSVVTYSIVSRDSDSFILDTTSGLITFKKAPDHETKSRYNFSVIAKDVKGNTSTQNISIYIIDIVDEVNPIWELPHTARVKENTINAIVLKAKDVSSITYSISGDDSNSFNFGLISGKVTFKKAPDYETKKLYRFKATATDIEGNKAVQDIIIHILDVDDTPPVFTPINTLQFEENTFHTITLEATDESNITYSISGDDHNHFTINPISGVISFKSKPDYEEKKSYNFNALARDEHGFASAQNIKINIIDIIDEINPIWISPNTKSVKENELNATILKAIDENGVTYSISGEDSKIFNVNSITGLVTFKEKVNYQIKSSYSFTSSATDKYGNIGTQQTTINLTFVNNIQRTFRGHASSVHSLSIMPSGGYVLTGSGDNTLKLWNTNTGEVVRTFSNHTNDILSVAITLDEKYLVIGSGDHNLKLIDINTTNLVKIFAGHTDLIHSVALSPDGQYVLSAGGSQDKTIRLWEIGTGKLKRTFTGHTGGIHSVTISRDGKYVLSGSNDETMKLWDINTGALINTFEHEHVVRSVAITPNGKYALSGSNDSSVTLWDINTGALIRIFKGHTDDIHSISITPNGKYVLSGSGDNSLKLWEISTGALIRTFNGHTNAISSISITSDGYYAFSGSWDNTLKLWDINISNP